MALSELSMMTCIIQAEARWTELKLEPEGLCGGKVTEKSGNFPEVEDCECPCKVGPHRPPFPRPGTDLRRRIQSEQPSLGDAAESPSFATPG